MFQYKRPNFNVNNCGWGGAALGWCCFWLVLHAAGAARAWVCSHLVLLAAELVLFAAGLQNLDDSATLLVWRAKINNINGILFSKFCNQKS